MSDKLKDVCWHCLCCDGDNLENYRCYDCKILGNKVYPSWSNIKYHLPVIKHFVKLIGHIKFEYDMRRAEKNYISPTETKELKHIWGIKSWDDLSSGNEANLYTMNDFDITYDKEKNKYMLGVETIYIFKDDKAEKDYMKGILKLFTEWMKENEYNTEYTLDLYEVFTKGININTEFDSIEQAYAAFKLLVEGYTK